MKDLREGIEKILNNFDHPNHEAITKLLLALFKETLRMVRLLEMMDMMKYGSRGDKCCEVGLTEWTRGWNDAVKRLNNNIDKVVKE